MKQPRWVLNRTALAVHRRQLAEHGGPLEVNMPRLFVGLGWPKTVQAFSPQTTSVYDLAAAYTEGVLRTRPFAAGNEQVAFVLAKLFRILNGARHTTEQIDEVVMFRAFEIGAIDRAQYSRWMLMHSVASEAGTIVRIRRDPTGQVVGVGILKRGDTAPKSRRGPAQQNPEATILPLLRD
jgi:death-on-curing protein